MRTPRTPRASASSTTSWVVYIAIAIAAFLIGTDTASSSNNNRALVEENKAKKEYYEKEEEAEVDFEPEQGETVELTTVICIVLLLVFLTIGFESFKEYLEEEVNKNMQPIIEKLFGEMTVLGFLSIFTFVVTQAGFFEVLSDRIFGEHEELLEIFEIVHFCIFFVMVFFVLQVLVLVREAMETEEMWLEMDRNCRNENAVARMATDGAAAAAAAAEECAPRVPSTPTRRRGILQRSYSSTNALNLLPGFRDEQHQELADELLYKALRDEFILERSQDSPFDPSPVRVEHDFNFGRYLSVCLSNTLTHEVEVSTKTWFLFAVASVLYYGYCLLVKENVVILAWTWVAAGWVLFLFLIYFERHLLRLRKAFVSKAFMNIIMSSSDAEGAAAGATEATHLTMPLNDNNPALPAWCDVNLEEYMDTRPWLRQSLVGGTPTRQQSLYWMDRKGPTLYLLIMQVNLIWTGLFCALQLLYFLPKMYEKQPWYIFWIYVVLAFAPILFTRINSKHLVATLTQVSSIGAYRRPQVVSDVLREEKTARLVRAFVVIYKMRRFAAEAGHHAPPTEETTTTQSPKRMIHSRSFTALEIAEVGKTFEAFDTSGDGHISYQEFSDLMNSLGAEMTQDEMQRMISHLDHDGNGNVCKEEFIQWYSEQMREHDDFSTHERAQFLFRLFDTNNSGEITIGEFKHKLDALNVGFTVDEVGAIVNELDEDNNGSVSLHEFEDLLEKYYPRELLDLEQEN